MTLDAASVDRYYPHISSTARSGVVLSATLDHALSYLASEDVFSVCGLALKGGAAAHKFRLGATGRLSFGLDFDGQPGSDAVVAETLEGVTLGGFRFSTTQRRGRYTLHCDTPMAASCSAKLDFSDRGLWIPAEACTFLPQPLHAGYTEAVVRPLPRIPVSTVDEMVAEKLCRWQNEPLVRDLYDLVALRRLVKSPEDVAAMWVLKAHIAMHEPMSRHPRRARAADASRLFSPQRLEVLALDDLVLPRPMPADDKHALVAHWVHALPSLYGFLPEVFSTELRRVAADTGGLAGEVRRLAHEFRESHRDLASPPTATPPRPLGHEPPPL